MKASYEQFKMEDVTDMCVSSIDRVLLVDVLKKDSTVYSDVYVESLKLAFIK